MSAEPRLHLYAFAHRALPAVGLSNPKQMLGVLSGPKAEDFLAFLWNDVGEGLEPAARMEFPELSPSVKRRGGFVIASIHFPSPREITEPHFAAFAFGPITENMSPDSLAARYFVLEHSLSLESNTPRTVMGEWSEGSHLNHGDGSEPSAEAFEQSVLKMVQAVQNDRGKMN